MDEASLAVFYQVGVGGTRHVMRWASPTSLTTAALLIVFSEFFVELLTAINIIGEKTNG